jgi:hypothetical protein
VFAQGKKSTFAVMTIKGSSGISQDEADLLSDRLRAELFKTGAVDVMERDQMQAILKEQGFQQSGACTNEGCMVEIGQILGVQKLVTGSIGKLGKMHMMNMRVIDIKTAKITVTVSEDVKGDIEDVVERLPKVALKLVQPESDNSSENKPAPVSKPDNKEESQNSPVSSDELDCNGKILLEKVEFSKSTIGFTLSESEWTTFYGKLSDEIKSRFSQTVCVATTAQIVNTHPCNSHIIRPVINSYTTRPTKLGEKEGILNLSLRIFDAPAAGEPVCTVNAEATGDNHWGDKIPFYNAMEAVAKKLNDALKSTACAKTIGNK